MRRTVASIAFALAASWFAPSSAWAQDGDGKQEVRRDPKGQKGISPYMEKLSEGRTASGEGKHDEAITAFDAAMKEDPDKLVPYLLKAQSLLAKGELDAAIEAAASGRQKQGTAAERSKLLFLSADLDERKKNSPPGRDNEPSMLEKLSRAWDEVKSSWSAYTALLDAQPVEPAFEGTADERKTKVDDRVKRDEDFAKVKERAPNQK